MRPVMVTRAIDPAVPPHACVPGARKAAAAAMTAPMATITAHTRQKVSLRRMRRRSTMRSASSDMLGSLPRDDLVLLGLLGLLGFLGFLGLLGLLGFLGFLGRSPRGAPERGAKNIAERCPRIRRAVLGNRLLLLRHFECLDRDLHLAGAAVEMVDPGADFLPDREKLLARIAAQC